MTSKGTRYKEEPIIRILKEVEGGASIAEVCRKYGGLDTSELQRLRELEAENSRLKKIVAQQVLDIDALKELLAKNGKPSCQTPRCRMVDGTRAVTTSSLSAAEPGSVIGQVSTTGARQ